MTVWQNMQRDRHPDVHNVRLKTLAKNTYNMCVARRKRYAAKDNALYIPECFAKHNCHVDNKHSAS